MKALHQTAIWMALTLCASVAGAAKAPITINEARSLSTPQLANELLGERLASRVIEARRQEYVSSSGSIPESVEFYTQPELSSPVVNGICRTDVIIVEYDWFEHDGVNASTPLKIARIAANSRYKSFPEPPGDPGTDAHTRAQTAACAQMNKASDAFRAPSGGDAQWLTAIHHEYSDPKSRFNFSCEDFADRSCKQAREALRDLALNSARHVELVDCPKIKTGDQVNYCYRLSFAKIVPYRFPDIGEYAELISPEWIVTVFAGMSDGSSPVKIRTLHMEHFSPPFLMQ